MKILKYYNKVMLGAMLMVLTLASCTEQTPAVFGGISGVYFNNRSNTNILQDSTEVTFVYQKGDEMEVPVAIQLLGSPADHDREISLTVTADGAQQGTDYTLPEKAVMPQGETSCDYIVKLKRTSAIKTEKKRLVLTLQANADFTLPVTKETVSNGDEVTTLSYTIIFSDQFTTAPKAWEKGLLGAFTQQKFELACQVLDLDPADFNDSEKMTLAMQSYVSAQMQTYVIQQESLKSQGLDYDKDAFDSQGNALKYSDD